MLQLCICHQRAFHDGIILLSVKKPQAEGGECMGYDEAASAVSTEVQDLKLHLSGRRQVQEQNAPPARHLTKGHMQL